MSSKRWSPPGLSATSPSRSMIAEVIGAGTGELASISEQINEGFDYRVFTTLQELLGMTRAQLAGLLRISESTLYRRRASGRFDPLESDRIWHYLQLYSRAVEVLEEHEAALEWLRAPLPALGGKSPLLAARDGAGVQSALAVLGRIETGVFG